MTEWGDTAPGRPLRLRAAVSVAMASLGSLLLAYALLDWIAFAEWVEAWL